MKKICLYFVVLSTLFANVSIFAQPAPQPNPQSIDTTQMAQIVYQPDSADIYVCSAVTGSAAASAVWQCKYVQITGTNVNTTWANGNNKFLNIATNPASLSYS